MAESFKQDKAQPMHSKSRKNQLIFIGSSSESIEVAHAIQRNLHGKKIDDQSAIEVEVWTQGVFRIGHETLSSLDSEARKCDFAILVFGKDSVIVDRDQHQYAPRDNVVFELGLLFGVIGVHRCFLVKHEGVKLPSDLDGLTVGSYDHPQHATLQAALASACSAITERIRSIVKDQPKAPHKETLTDKYVKWWDKANRRTTTEVIQTIDGLEISVSPSVFSPDTRLTHSPIVVYKKLPKDLRDKTVLDVGTGCGVLAIAAALRGAKRVVAVDVKQEAIDNARENVDKLVSKGRIQKDSIEVIESDLFERVSGKYDYIMANLPIATDAESW